jgi:acyl-CoA synthetase (AMP-forming)/AMP-acid ligase II
MELPDRYRQMVGRATIGDQLRRHGQHTPEKPAIIFYYADGRRQIFTYSALNARVNRFAHALRDLGVRRGDVVSVLSRNSPDYITAWYACLKLGASLSSLNFTFTEREISYQAGHCEPKVLIVEDLFADRIAAMADKLTSVRAIIVSDMSGKAAPENWPRFSDLVAESLPASEPESDVCELDVAMIQYTSGTEAFPKGVMITHRNYLISTTPAWMAALGLKPADIWLFVMPFFTIAGLGSMTSLTILGATIILVQTIDPAQALRIIAEERVTVMAQTPTFYLAMTQVPGFRQTDVGCLERCLTYGGTVPKVMIDEWQALAPQVVWGTYWGQSELSQLGSVGWFRTLEEIPGGDPTWIGKPVPQLEVRVVDADGQDAEVGELICRSPSAMLGYYKDDARTAEVFRDGWLHTNDLVRIDADGNLFFYDRAKDVIKSGGMNVSSQEVERILYQHPAVFMAAVVGLPDEKWGEAVTAFVVAKPGAVVDPDALIAHCREQMAAYKLPKAVHVVEALPRDTQGKILKRELRRMHQKA